jgi:transcriptional regulator with XRE-family HTH domain
MTSESVSDVVAERVREVRKRQGLTARALAERCAAAGTPGLTAQALSNIESGRRGADDRRRRDVTVDELFALAAALNVAPVHLLVPPKGPTGKASDEERLYNVTPGKAVRREDVRRWVRGFDPLPGSTAADFHAEAPDHEYGVHWLPLKSSEAVRRVLPELYGEKAETEDG